MFSTEKGNIVFWKARKHKNDAKSVISHTFKTFGMLDFGKA